MPDVAVTIRRDEAVLDLLQPLWESMRAHHAALPDVPRAQDPDVSWSLKRAEYRRRLAEPASFVVLAEHGGTTVGYAFVTVEDGPDDTWATGDRIAELQSLAVLPELRGTGVGNTLFDAVEAELETAEVHDLQLAVTASNVDAMRFYARRGLAPRLVVLSNYGRRTQ